MLLTDKFAIAISQEWFKLYCPEQDGKAMVFDTYCEAHEFLHRKLQGKGNVVTICLLQNKKTLIEPA